MRNLFHSKYTCEQVEAMFDMISQGVADAALCKCCGAPLTKDGKCEYCGVQYKYVLERKDT